MVSKFKPQISLFDTIDKNNDNEISKEELKAFYPDLTDEEIDRLFRLYDKDKSGTLNRSEFTLTSLG
jgi:Ca2+-binding EF-hand superfamily protein